MNFWYGRSASWLVGDGALRAAVAADREVTRMEGAKLDHVAEYLAHVRETYVPPLVRLRGDELLVRLAGDGTPEVREFTVCEVAAALGLSQPAATGLCADVLDLTYRLRRIAGYVRSGELPFARARVIARRTRELSVHARGVRRHLRLHRHRLTQRQVRGGSRAGVPEPCGRSAHERHHLPVGTSLVLAEHASGRDVPRPRPAG